MDSTRGPNSVRLPAALDGFVDTCEWRFAKTYADTWPHEYIVRNWVDAEQFESFVRFIREHSSPGPFYRLTIGYLRVGELVYWTMVPPEAHPKWYPVEEETVINRCPVESTYEARLAAGTLPEDCDATD